MSQLPCVLQLLADHLGQPGVLRALDLGGLINITGKAINLPHSSALPSLCSQSRS